MLRTPLFWKLAVTFMGYLVALLNQFIDPTELITFPDDASPYTASAVRAGGFALITAIALFVGMIPTGNEDRDKQVDNYARFLGVLCAFGAGWYSLESATHGQPVAYVAAMSSLTGFALLTILFAGGYVAIFKLAEGALRSALLFLHFNLTHLTRFREIKLPKIRGKDD